MNNNYDGRNGFPSTVGIKPEGNTKKFGKSRLWLVNLLLIGAPILLCVILIVVFMLTSKIPVQEQPSSKCLFSTESIQSNLTYFLNQIQLSYYSNLHRNKIYTKPGVTPEEIRSVFRPYDPSPMSIQFRTDKAANLLRQLNALKINTTQLKLRERKALHVARAILKNNFGWAPYTQNYYIGDWLLGPDMFCWQPICYVFWDLNMVIDSFKPHNTRHLEQLKVLFEQHNETFERYIDNLKLGVRSGYVRPTEACRAGLHNLHYVHYRSVAIGNYTGIYDEQFSATLLKSGYFEHLSENDNKTWERLHDANVTIYFERLLINNVARPAVKMLRYLEKEHLRNCVPSSLASGLGNMPLPYSYTDWIPDTSKSALKTLPTGEELLGSHTYEELMSFFTTTNIRPAELREKAVERLNMTYKEAIKIAQTYTDIEDKETATKVFARELQAVNMQFNSETFPSNESGDAAFIKCMDVESAKAFCPKRWKAMEAWIESTVETAKVIDPTVKNMFYDEGPKNCVPACPIEVVPWFHPHGVFHSYNPGSKDCSFLASQGLPFFVETFGPKWTEYTTTAHEQFPGHHLEVMSFVEYFEDDCGDAITWLSTSNYFTAITEGWATYSEHQLLLNDTTVYSNKTDKAVLRQKYGMLYYQLLAALRAIVDIDLNYHGKSKEDALRMYREYVWQDATHQVLGDITRIQSAPGIVTSYLTGEIEISRVRALAEIELGTDFSLKDFHYQVLRQGEYPLDYLEEHVRAYIACKKDPAKEECKEILQ